jgi:D-alanyl-D-alanine carboxypeptidase
MLTQYYTLTGDPTVTVFDTYRSAEDQKNSGSLPPGYSEHHTALNVRLCALAANKSYADLNANTHPWIYEHCHEYGFIQRYQAGKEAKTGYSEETWHFRYVGVPHSFYMKENDLCLEEYIAELENYLYDTEHLIFEDDMGNKWEIFTVKLLNSGDVTIELPEDAVFTSSGTNCGSIVIAIDVTNS